MTGKGCLFWFIASPWLDHPVGCGRDVLVSLLSEEIIRRVITGTWSPKWPTIQTCILLQSIIVLFCYRLFNSALWEDAGITHLLWKSSCTAQERLPRDFLLYLQQTLQLWFSRADTNLGQLGGNLRLVSQVDHKDIWQITSPVCAFCHSAISFYLLRWCALPTSDSGWCTVAWTAQSHRCMKYCQLWRNFNGSSDPLLLPLQISPRAIMSYF